MYILKHYIIYDLNLGWHERNVHNQAQMRCPLLIVQCPFLTVHDCSKISVMNGNPRWPHISLMVTRKFLDWKFLFESSQTKIAWKLIPWPENCWLRKFRDCNFLACKFLDPKIPCTENSLKAPWDENSLTRAKGYNWLPRAATVPERIALKISNI